MLSLCLSTTIWGSMGEWRYGSRHYWPRHRWNWVVSFMIQQIKRREKATGMCWRGVCTHEEYNNLSLLSPATACFFWFTETLTDQPWTRRRCVRQKRRHLSELHSDRTQDTICRRDNLITSTRVRNVATKNRPRRVLPCYFDFSPYRTWFSLKIASADLFTYFWFTWRWWLFTLNGVKIEND